MKLYLAHPLVLRKKIRKIELKIERETGLELENPFYDDICGNRHDVKQMDKGKMERDDSILDYKQIVENDLTAISKCDGVVCYIEKGVYSLGTLFEAWSAMVTGKQVYVVSPDSLMHPWVRYLIFKSGGRGWDSWADFKRFWEVVQKFQGASKSVQRRVREQVK